MKYFVVLLSFVVVGSWLVFAPGVVSADERDGTAARRYVRIGHFQCVCRQGDFEANLKKVIEGLELASEARLYHEYLMIYNLDLQKKHRSQLNRRSMKSANALLDILQDVLDAHHARN